MKIINVLIVEDEFIIALDIKEILEDNGFHVLSIVTNYNDAINLIEHKSPDLVIIDVKLSQSLKDGIDLGNYLLNSCDTPFIYVTSINDKYNLSRIIESRPNGFIAKPYKKIDILTTINIALHNVKHANDVVEPVDPNSIDEAPYLIKKVINYIHLNFDKRIKINDLVNMTRWKKHHFIRIFSEYVGVTPYTYILNNKIEHAKLLLSDNQLKLEEVACNLGFQSYINFARTFKNYTQTSPNQFRIQNNIKNNYLKKVSVV